MEVRVEGPQDPQRALEEDLDLFRRAEPMARLYRWDRRLVTIGVSQTRAVVNEEMRLQHGVHGPLQRATGGGAVCHEQNELVYSIILPIALDRNVRSSFRIVSDVICDAINELGPRVEIREGEGGNSPACYLRPRGVWVVQDGRIISGSSQRRSRDVILQHGTILERSVNELTTDLLGVDPSDVSRAVGNLGIVEGLERRVAQGLGRLLTKSVA